MNRSLILEINNLEDKTRFIEFTTNSFKLR